MTLILSLPGGIEMFGQAKSTTPGAYIGEGDFAWFEGVDIRRDEEDLPQAHGSFDVPGYLTSRTFPVSGFFVAKSEAELEHFGNRITGVLAGGNAGRVQVKWNGDTTWADMRLGARTKFVPDRAALIGEFQITFWAADPRKYGDTSVFAAGVAASHRGNFAATPVHTVSGVGAGYTINGPSGKTFTVTKAVTSGHPHTIDMATGLLVVDGAVVVGQVTSADTWAVPPGGVVTHTLSGAGLTLSTALKDTFI